jgi:nitrogenase iron protein NifH
MLDRSETVQDAEEKNMTVIEAFPESRMAEEYRALAERILAVSGPVKEPENAEGKGRVC